MDRNYFGFMQVVVHPKRTLSFLFSFQQVTLDEVAICNKKQRENSCFINIINQKLPRESGNPTRERFKDRIIIMRRSNLIHALILIVKLIRELFHDLSSKFL